MYKFTFLIALILVIALSLVEAGSKRKIDVSFDSKSVLRAQPDLKKQNTGLLSRAANTFLQTETNKVRVASRFIANMANERTYREPSLDSGKRTVDSRDYSRMTVQQIMELPCEGRSYQGPCSTIAHKFTEIAPEISAEISQKVKDKPNYAPANKVIGAGLLEAGVNKMEEYGIDEKLNNGFNSMFKRTPMGYAATKGMDMALGRLKY